MSVDLTQFHQVFFEESFEGLDAMETALMALDPDDIEAETINCIFRAAHSIKGGSATFGFNIVADFTHVLETLLDEIRDGKRPISTEDINLFLQSVDCLRDLISALQSNSVPDTERSNELKELFQHILDDDRGAILSAKKKNEILAFVPSQSTGDEKIKCWHIYFKPNPEILRTGNEPLRMFRELAEKGDLIVSAIVDDIPNFAALNPELCHLSWRLTLRGEVAKADVEEVFEWVADEAEILIQAVTTEFFESATTKDTAEGIEGWSVQFTPGEDILRTGNDPVRMLRELAENATIQVEVDDKRLPSFAAMNPEKLYLSWHIVVNDALTKQEIEQVFEWVVDESVIDIHPLMNSSTSHGVTSDATSSLVETDSGQRFPLKTDPAENRLAESRSTENGPVENSPVEKVPANKSIEEKNPDNVSSENRSATKRSTKPAVEASSIRVAIDKIDNLINMVGELVITQSMLGQIGNNFSEDQLPRLREGLGQLEHNTRELQESVMRIRMLPISFAFSRFPRMVRDLSQRLNKEIDLVVSGEQTELDKTVMERIGDPLVHLVRNAVDHGIELPQERIDNNKPACGKITLNAFHQSGNVVIEIIDDGKGLPKERIVEKAREKGLITQQDAISFSDAQIYDLIFHPGFSTAQQVSDVSGRGVGMDVVKRNIQALNGTVDIKSALNKGTTITIRLPLTLAILDGQLVRVGSNIYIFPLVSIVESLQIDDSQLNMVAGGCEVFQLRDEYVPVVRLHEVFDVQPDSRQLKDSLLVVVESEGEKVGLVVDDLAAQQQVVIKSLEQNYRKVEGVSGATILGDGTVSLILDIPGIVSLAGIHHQRVNRMKKYQKSVQQELRIH